MSEPVYQCATNISEGRDPASLDSLAGRLQRIGGLRLADYSWDSDHHRAVFSMLGRAQAYREAIPLIFEWADENVDMSQHQGEHPRIGAVDVVPFIPLRGAPMKGAIELAQELGQQLAERFNLPVFLYEEAASGLPLPQIRKQVLAGAIEPDQGPSVLHPRLGAAVIGARKPLLAYNVVLDTDRVEVAKAIARCLRESSGGLVSVRALGIALESHGRVQVSMNLTDPSKVPLYRAFEMVKMEARRFGVSVCASELIGLATVDSLLETARYYLRCDDLKSEQIIENQLLTMQGV